LGIPLANVAASYPVALLIGLCLALVGASLGALAKNYGQIDLVGNLVYFAVVFLSPTFVPFDQMARPFQLTSYLLPTGQGALALCEALARRFGLRFWTLTSALALWTLVAAFICIRKLDFGSE
jgi:hypothetical protein